VLETAQSSNEFPWISLWTLVKPHACYCVDVVKAHWLRPVFTESYRWYAWIRRKNVWLFSGVSRKFSWGGFIQWH